MQQNRTLCADYFEGYKAGGKEHEPGQETRHCVLSVADWACYSYWPEHGATPVCTIALQALTPFRWKHNGSILRKLLQKSTHWRDQSREQHCRYAQGYIWGSNIFWMKHYIWILLEANLKEAHGGHSIVLCAISFEVNFWGGSIHVFPFLSWPAIFRTHSHKWDHPKQMLNDHK